MSGHHEHDPAAPTTLEAWISAMSRPQPSKSGRLPSHSPTCAGCGTENPAGLALQVDATEAGVRCVHRFDHRQEGAPGITHTTSLRPSKLMSPTRAASAAPQLVLTPWVCLGVIVPSTAPMGVVPRATASTFVLLVSRLRMRSAAPSPSTSPVSAV